MRHPLTDDPFDFGKLCVSCAHWTDTKRVPRTCTLAGRQLDASQAAGQFLACTSWVSNGKPFVRRKGQRGSGQPD